MHAHIATIPTNPAAFPALRYKLATLYYLRIEFPSSYNDKDGKGNIATNCSNPLVLYKLGYTTTSLQERVHGKPVTYRYTLVKGKRKYSRTTGHNGMGLPAGTQVYVIASITGKCASTVYQWEQYLHNKHRNERWQGLPLMENGNTELYIKDILNLDN